MFHKNTAAGLMIALCVFLPGCDVSPEKSPQVEAIRKRGVLRAGVKFDVPRFGYLAPGTSDPEGLEIDIARLIAGELLGDAGRIQFTPVTAQLKGPALDNDLVDFVIAAYTITEERKKRYHFTSPYYTSDIRLLVRKDSGIRSLADMDGKTAGISRTSTSRAALQAEADRLGITLKYTGFSSHPEIMAALLSGTVDAFVNDYSAIMGYKEDNTILLDGGFSPQPYGIAVKLDNGKLAAYLEGILTAIRDDGRLGALLEKWDLEPDDAFP
jgi:putative glutamine transport system substrate-binding protein